MSFFSFFPKFYQCYKDLLWIIVLDITANPLAIIFSFFLRGGGGVQQTAFHATFNACDFWPLQATSIPSPTATDLAPEHLP